MKAAKDILLKAGNKLILPVDIVATDELKEGASTETYSVTNFPADKIGVDIGKESITFFEDELVDAGTIVWNGPVGAFEIPGFDKGSVELANFISNLKCIKIAGGGDTADLLDRTRVADKFTHISTGGGASLEFLAGKKLPGIKALEDNEVEFG